MSAWVEWDECNTRCDVGQQVVVPSERNKSHDVEYAAVQFVLVLPVFQVLVMEQVSWYKLAQKQSGWLTFRLGPEMSS